MRKRIIIFMTIFALCLSLTACGNGSSNKNNNLYEAVAEGEEMRDFTGELVGGGELKLSDLKGKVILLNFWATWCGPCVGEMPAFPKLMEKYGDDLALVTVNVGEDAETIQEFLDKNSYSELIVFLDEDYAISNLYPSEGIPYTIIIDREGVISATQLGAHDADTMFYEYSSLIDTVLLP
ncbi:MAG: TlpA family protein disulfide reductase [Lachnospiraceae bacterium]|nr:TlpA family protein disulfide reductase [Lachnospiraceae bacterium]